MKTYHPKTGKIKPEWIIKRSFREISPMAEGDLRDFLLEGTEPIERVIVHQDNFSSMVNISISPEKGRIIRVTSNPQHAFYGGKRTSFDLNLKDERISFCIGGFRLFGDRGRQYIIHLNPRRMDG